MDLLKALQDENGALKKSPPKSQAMTKGSLLLPAAA
jgi:hypothetical protein